MKLALSLSQRPNEPTAKLRIGFFLETKSRFGGSFQQSLSTITALVKRLPEYDIVVLTPYQENFLALQDTCVRVELYSIGWRGKLDEIQSLSQPADYAIRFFRRLGFRNLGRNLDQRLDELEIDIAIFNTFPTALRLVDHPFIISVFDLCHRDMPELPGTALGGEFQRREIALQITAPRAVAVIANCLSGAERISRIYNVEANRIVILPFFPSIAVREHAVGKGSITAKLVRAHYGLHENYIFYPAQFCADKNHVYLLEALVALEQIHGIQLHAAFSGSDAGNRAHVESYAQRLEIADRIHFLGFLPDDHIPALYEGAVALGMPSYGGPTNIPPLEAATLGCPIIYSDLPEWREFMRDAALYCNLSNPLSMAEHLYSLLTTPELIERLREAGRRLIDELGEDDYAKKLKPVLDEFAYLRRIWAK